MKKFYAIMGFFATFWLNLLNGEVVVKSEFRPAKILMDGTAKWVITVEGATIQQVNFRPPVMDGIVLTYQQGAFHTQFINDKMTRSTIWTFRVTPKKPGTFSLPPVNFVWEGKTLTVPSATLTVENISTLTESAQDNRGQVPPLFLEVKYNRPQKWFVGQSVPAQLNLYVGAQLRGQLLSMLTKEGDEFSATRLTAEPTKAMVQIQNRQYTKLCWESLLTPIKSGNTTLKFGLDLALDMPSQRMSMFDDDDDGDPFGFFNRALGGMLTEKRQTRAETPLENISVMSLPMESQPQDFSGSIGHFSLIPPHILEKEAIANESLTFVVEIKGEGNFEAFNKDPNLIFDEKIWRNYAPKVAFEADDVVGFCGKMRYEFILVPLKSGKQSLPEVNFTFFDPLAATYKTIKSAASDPIDVKPPLPTKSSIVAPSSPSDTEEKPADGQLPYGHISLRTNGWHKTNLPWISKKSFIFCQIALLKLWLLIFTYEYYRFRKRSDKDFVHLVALQKQLKKYEKLALQHEANGNVESYYDALYQMLQTAVALKSKKFDGSFSWSLEEIEEILSQQNCSLSLENIEVLREVINLNHQMKFGQGVGPVRIDFKVVRAILKEILKN